MYTYGFCFSFLHRVKLIFFQEYEIEKLMNYVESDLGLMYLVQWKGHKPTWQLEADLTNCDQLLCQFHSVSSLHVGLLHLSVYV